MKVCTICKKEKEENEFYRSLKGYENQCKSCRDQKHYQNRINNRIEKGLPVRSIGNSLIRELRERGLKYCSTCKRILDINEFSTMKVRGGIPSKCKKCMNEYAEKHRNKEKQHLDYIKYKDTRKNYKLIKKFGITLEEYNNLLEKQNFSCAICNKTIKENGKSLAVDHDHKTNKVRGLLCNNCNVSIGFLSDNPELTIKIKQYLEEV